MVEREQYFDCLYWSLASEGMIPGVGLWRKNLENAVDYLGIDKSFAFRLRREYGVQFSDVMLFNSAKNLLACQGFGITASKELCAASVYFSMLGCLLDYWLDSGIDELRRKGMQKLSWEHCKCFFQDFNNGTSIEDISDELFGCVSKGMERVYHDAPKLFEYLVELMQQAADAEIAATKYGLDISDEMIYNKSVLFVEAALLLAMGNKRFWNEYEYNAVKNVGYLFALMDDLLDVFEDIDNHQQNIFVKKLQSGKPYQEIITYGINRICELETYIRNDFGDRFADLIWHEISDWVYTNNELTRRMYESRG